MDVISTFMVSPSLPDKLQHLQPLAYNVWWAWNLEAVDLFRRLDPDLWETSGHNPVLMLGTINQERLEQAAQDEGYVAQLETVYRRFQEYLESKSTWFHRTFPDREKADGQPVIAYFSMEYGLTEALPIYSGGLGVLSGDHLKASSDLGVPLVGVGLFYQQGYFRQYLNAEGWQQERYPINDFYNLPAHLEHKPDGSPVTIAIDFPNGPLYAQIWRIQVGRISLIMLDTNIAQNRPEYRDITNQLYGGDNETRIQQEILLGIGGIRALEALNLHPTICHMNEGHAAFLGLERWRVLRSKLNLEPAVAREIVAEGSVFTTHTNVPAAIDIFHPGLMDKYFANYYPQLGIGREEFLSLGRQSIFDMNESFSMPVLAMRLSGGINGVSKLHGQVARGLWNRIWTGTPEQEVPIGSITNGIHARSFASHEMDTLLMRYLGPRWIEDPSDKELWKQISHIPDEELWQVHEVRRAKLVAFSRRRLRQQLEQRGAPQTDITQAMEVLHPDTLTIGFARRFATYKRATLIFRDLERLARILNNRDMPVQIVFSGKAHPHDNLGKELIRQIFQITRRDEFRRKIIFLEDYDLVIARYLVQGVDVWLNTPTRPLEASGTSGMKAALNGGLNFSTLDGWWAEAYNPSVGWAIGHGESYSDPTQQDEIEARAFYETLEKEIVPLFYQRGLDGLPRGWISKMKSSISEISPVFNANRMVHEYTEQYYLPVACRFDAFIENDGALARDFTAWKSRIYEVWPRVKVLRVERKTGGDLKVNQEMQVEAQIDLAGLSPSDVSVQLYHGMIGADGQLVDPVAVQMHSVSAENNVYTYEGMLKTKASGRYGYALRVLPYHPELTNPHELGVVHWAPSNVAAS